jgi:hypothetical protein
MYHAKKVISRCRSLIIRPDFPKLKELFPYLWQQAEYVLTGAATCVWLPPTSC